MANSCHNGFFGPEPDDGPDGVLLGAAAVLGGGEKYGVSAAPVHFYFAVSFSDRPGRAGRGDDPWHTAHVHWYPGCRFCGASRESRGHLRDGYAGRDLLPSPPCRLMPTCSGGPSWASDHLCGLDLGAELSLPQRHRLLHSICMGFSLWGPCVELRLEGLTGREAHAGRDPHQASGAAPSAQAGIQAGEGISTQRLYHVIHSSEIYFFYRGASTAECGGVARVAGKVKG